MEKMRKNEKYTQNKTHDRKLENIFQKYISRLLRSYFSLFIQI